MKINYGSMSVVGSKFDFADHLHDAVSSLRYESIIDVSIHQEHDDIYRAFITYERQPLEIVRDNK